SAIEMEVEGGKDLRIGKGPRNAGQVCRANGVTQNHMSQFVRQHGGKSRLIGQHVEKPAAKHNGAAHHERFQWSGEQHAAADTGNVEVVGNQQIVEHGLQDPVDI